MKDYLSDVRGLTLTELIVVVAIIGLVAVIGIRYYFTNVEMYRFQKVLTDFKSSLNLARVRSMSGRVVSTGDVAGQTPAAIPLATIQLNGNTASLTRTSSTPSLTTGSYVTLLGLAPQDSTLNFPYSINGCICRITSSSGTSLTLELLNQDPDNFMKLDTSTEKKPNFSPLLDPITSQPTPSILKPSAYAFLKYSVWIKPVTSIDGGAYSEVNEIGPEMDFKYNQDAVKVEIALQTSTGAVKQEQPCMILFDKGLTVACQTYNVTFTLLKSGAVASVDISPTGAVR